MQAMEGTMDEVRTSARHLQELYCALHFMRKYNALLNKSVRRFLGL